MNHLILRPHAARQLHIQPLTLLLSSRHRLSSTSASLNSTTVRSLETTRPAPLDLPAAPHPLAWPSSASKNPTNWDFKYLFYLGRAYGKFFWTGVKNVYSNYKTTSGLKKRLGRSLDSAARSKTLSYVEYELALRTKRDLKKLLPFGLVFAICGEFTPLVILAVGSAIVPTTCVIPKQVVADQKRMQQREQRYMMHIAENWAKYSAASPTPSSAQSERRDLQRLQRQRRQQPNSQQQSDSQSPDQHQVRQPIITAPDLHRLHISSSMSPFLYSLRENSLKSKLRTQCLEVLNTASLVAAEGGWKTKSAEDLYEWGTKYGSYSLRTYVEAALNREEEPISEQMKTELLPIFENETKMMLEYAEKASEQDRWMGGYHSWRLFPERPDCMAQRKDLEVLAGRGKIEAGEVLKKKD